MDILFTKGKEGMRVPASLVYLPMQRQTLDNIINNLTIAVQTLNADIKTIVDDDSISDNQTYSSQKIVQLLTQINENITNLNGDIQDQLNNIYDYINNQIYQQPIILSSELSYNNQIKLILSDFINNIDLSNINNNFTASINGSPLTILTVTQEGTNVNLSQGTFEGIEESSGQIKLQGW